MKTLIGATSSIKLLSDFRERLARGPASTPLLLAVQKSFVTMYFFFFRVFSKILQKVQNGTTPSSEKLEST